MTREKVIRATIAEVIDKLTYINYKHNRKNDATMPTDWYPIYGRAMVFAMEKQYQEELLDFGRYSTYHKVDRMEERYQKERHANVHPVFRVILQGVCDD